MNEGSDEYLPSPTEDPHKRTIGLHEAIKKVLEKKICLKPQDIKRIVFTYFGHSSWRKGENNYFAQVTIDIFKEAFFMGNLIQGDAKIPSLLGWFWIGKTKYEIWREY
jgi:hypothetical protein